jgi:uncharacterized protein YbjT (DUF2867 family)
MQYSRTALIFGATGLVGKELLYLLLEHKSYLLIKAVVRKPLAIKHPQLQQIVVENYDTLHEYASDFSADDVFCCLGTTIKDAGSQQAFRKVDETYVIQAAQLSLQAGCKHFYAVSAMGADKHSSIFYNKVKGEVEEQLSRLDFETVAVFRPSLLLGARQKLRLGEFMAQKILRPLSILFAGPLLKYKPIPAQRVAKAILATALNPQPGFHILENDRLFKLSH